MSWSARIKRLEGLEWMLIGIIAVVLLLSGIAFYLDATTEKFSLKKQDWQCTDTQVRNVLTTIMVGDKMSMIPSTKSVCVKYERIGK